MPLAHTHTDAVEVGDWVTARGVPGRSGRSGQITEVLGDERHRRYRVRWDESHESILYPADGVSVAASRRPGRRRSEK